MSRFRGAVPGSFTLFHSFESPLAELPALTHVNEAVCTADHVLPAHTHPTLEICYFLAGHAQWSAGGERFRLGPGDFYVSRPGEAHAGVPDPRDPNHNFAVGFDPEQLSLTRTSVPRQAPDQNLSPTLKNSGIAAHPPFMPAIAGSDMGLAAAEACAVAEDQPLASRVIPGGHGAERIYRSMLHELDRIDGQDAPSRMLTVLQIQALLIELFVFVTRLAIAHRERATPQRALGGAMRAGFSELLAWLPTRLADPPSLPELAARVRLTPSHFTVAFKREVGETPLEYLTTLRVDEAARRLRAGADAVTDIALDLGFSSSQYFSLVFKKRKGRTPSEWRGR